MKKIWFKAMSVLLIISIIITIIFMLYAFELSTEKNLLKIELRKTELLLDSLKKDCNN